MSLSKTVKVAALVVLAAVVSAGTWAGIRVATAKSAPARKLWHTRSSATPAPRLRVYDFAPLVKSVRPAVVNVYSVKGVRSSRRYGRRWNHWSRRFRRDRRRFDGWMPRWWRQSPKWRSPFRRRSSRPRRSLGSGFIINREGLVLTNHHVVRAATSVMVKLSDGRQFAAKVVGSDRRIDVALLKIKATKARFPYVHLGDSNRSAVGSPVIAIGNPHGLGHSVTAGIISGKGRVLGNGPYDNFIQTDAAINHGNSGGPLFNTRGEVIGINTAILRAAQGIGFAIPINLVKRLLPQLHSKGRVDRAMLGVLVQSLTQQLASSFGLKSRHGALVTQVSRGSGAKQAGLLAGDVIVAVDGVKVADHHHLPRLIAFRVPGSKIKLKVIRNKKVLTLKVKLQAWRTSRSSGWGRKWSLRNDDDDDDSDTDRGAYSLGVVVRSLDEATRTDRKVRSGGVIVGSVVPGSPAHRNGIRPGDVIVKVDRKKVGGPRHFGRLVAKAKRAGRILIYIKRRAGALYLAFTL